MLATKVTEPAQSYLPSPIVIVPKKDGTPEFCAGFRKLNEITIPYSFLIPRMDECIDNLGDSTLYYVLDNH